MSGAIAAVMPSHFEGATAEEQAALYGQTTAELIARCSERMGNGQADLILEMRSELQDWLLDRAHPHRCHLHEFSRGVDLSRANPSQVFLAMNKSTGVDFYHDVQLSLAWLRMVAPVDVLATILQRDLRQGEACEGGDDEEDAAISLESQLGCFLIVGGTSALALLLSLLEALLARRRSMRDERSSEVSSPPRADVLTVRKASDGSDRDNHSAWSSPPSARGGAPLADGEIMRETARGVKQLAMELADLKSQLAGGLQTKTTTQVQVRSVAHPKPGSSQRPRARPASGPPSHAELWL